MRIKLLSLISFIVLALNYNVSAQVTETKKYPFLPGNYYTIERQSWDVNAYLRNRSTCSSTDLNVYNRVFS
jgi:hypothetical protein